MDIADRIHLRDYLIEADIGAFQSERGQTQRLRFNLTVDLARPVSGAEDQVDSILSYDVLIHAIQAGLADQRYNLLETLAEKIAADVLKHPRAAQVEIGIEKLDRVPGALGITITRRAARIVVDETPAIAPSVLLAAAPLPDAPTGSTVILPGAPGLPLPETGDQRRIALLALDQAAWALAGQLGLDVADSRTEIDWSIREGLPVVWAPFRMVADEAQLSPDPLMLAQWLAGRLGATAVDVALPPGTALPQTTELPIRQIT